MQPLHAEKVYIAENLEDLINKRDERGKAKKNWCSVKRHPRAWKKKRRIYPFFQQNPRIYKFYSAPTVSQHA